MLTFLFVLSVFASVDARDHRHNKKGYLSHGKSSEETVDDVQMWTYIGIEKVVDFQGPRYGFWCGVESSVGVEVTFQLLFSLCQIIKKCGCLVPVALVNLSWGSGD